MDGGEDITEYMDFLDLLEQGYDLGFYYSFLPVNELDHRISVRKM